MSLSKIGTNMIGTAYVLPTVDGSAGQTFVTDGSGNITFKTPSGDTGVRALTANWESTYTTVLANSATWDTGGGSFIVEDANTIIGLSVFL